MIAEIIKKEIIWKILTVADPDAVIIFGSQALNAGNVNSDVDILVIIEVVGSKRRLESLLHLALADLPLPKDILVVNPDDYLRFKDIPGSVVYDAEREGVIIYKRAA